MEPYKVFPFNSKITTFAGEEQLPVHLRVHQVLSPWPRSIVLACDIVQSPSSMAFPPKVWLKLFDRRFNVEDRDRLGVDPWVPRNESGLLSHLQRAPEEVVEGVRGWLTGGKAKLRPLMPAAAVKEAIIGETSHENYRKELAVYQQHVFHQGVHIPDLYATVMLPIGPYIGYNGDEQIRRSCFTVPGIIMNARPGFTADHLIRSPDYRDDWENIINSVAAFTRNFLTHSPTAIHTDIRPNSFMVWPSQAAQYGYRVVLADLIDIQVHQGESETQWRQLKH